VLNTSRFAEKCKLMPIQLRLSNGTLLPNLIQDQSIDSSQTSVTLIGKGWVSYAEYLDQNFVSMLENFAGLSHPNAPLTGQLWYDSNQQGIKVQVGIGGPDADQSGWTSIFATQNYVLGLIEGATIGSGGSDTTSFPLNFPQPSSGAWDVSNVVPGTLQNPPPLVLKTANTGWNAGGLTYAPAANTGSTYTNIVVNSKGLVINARPLVASDITDLGISGGGGSSSGPRPYLVAAFIPGLLLPNQYLFAHAFGSSVTFQANFTTSNAGEVTSARSLVNATSTTVLHVQKCLAASDPTISGNWSNVGTLTYSGATSTATAATTSGSAITFAQGDFIRVVAPPTSDNTLSGVFITFAGDDNTVTGTSAGVGQRPYLIAGFVPGLLNANQYLVAHSFGTAVRFAGNFGISNAGEYTAAKAMSNATSSTVLNVQKCLASNDPTTAGNWVNVGSVTFAANTTNATLATSSSAAINFATGDMMRVVSPSSSDRTLSNIFLTFAGDY
jgi:hypothetical protein